MAQGYFSFLERHSFQSLTAWEQISASPLSSRGDSSSAYSLQLSDCFCKGRPITFPPRVTIIGFPFASLAHWLPLSSSPPPRICHPESWLGSNEQDHHCIWASFCSWVYTLCEKSSWELLICIVFLSIYCISISYLLPVFAVVLNCLARQRLLPHSVLFLSYFLRFQRMAHKYVVILEK